MRTIWLSIANAPAGSNRRLVHRTRSTQSSAGVAVSRFIGGDRSVRGLLRLVWVAETRVMNPMISDDLIQRELERDPEAAKANGWQDSATIWKAHSRWKQFKRV